MFAKFRWYKMLHKNTVLLKVGKIINNSFLLLKGCASVFFNIDNITNNRARLREFYHPIETGSVGYMK